MLKILTKSIWIIASTLLGCVLALVLTVPRAAGIHPYVVLSGSMEPAIQNEQVIGTVVFSIPFIGYAVSVLASRGSVMILAAMVILVFTFAPSPQNKQEAAGTEKNSTKKGIRKS